MHAKISGHAQCSALLEIIKYFWYSTQVSKIAMTSNFNHRLKIMESWLNVLSTFEDSASCFHKGKLTMMSREKWYLLTEKCSEDSVELAGL